MNARPKKKDAIRNRFLLIRRVKVDCDDSNSEVTSNTSAVIASHRLKSFNEIGRDILLHLRPNFEPYFDNFEVW